MNNTKYGTVNRLENVRLSELPAALGLASDDDLYAFRRNCGEDSVFTPLIDAELERRFRASVAKSGKPSETWLSS